MYTKGPIDQLHTVRQDMGRFDDMGVVLDGEHGNSRNTLKYNCHVILTPSPDPLKKDIPTWV